MARPTKKTQRLRRAKLEKMCEYYVRIGEGVCENRPYAHIVCKASALAIGFSDNPVAITLSRKCYNAYSVKEGYLHARESHVKQFCKESPKKCSYYIRRKAWDKTK